MIVIVVSVQKLSYNHITLKFLYNLILLSFLYMSRKGLWQSNFRKNGQRCINYVQLQLNDTITQTEHEPYQELIMDNKHCEQIITCRYCPNVNQKIKRITYLNFCEMVVLPLRFDSFGSYESICLRICLIHIHNYIIQMYIQKVTRRVMYFDLKC